ncbi:MAG: Tvp18 family protein [Firmicutes bacterium]|nr:Tvp18 family protein [Bacillota bacterium]
MDNDFKKIVKNRLTKREAFMVTLLGIVCIAVGVYLLFLGTVGIIFGIILMVVGVLFIIGSLVNDTIETKEEFETAFVKNVVKQVLEQKQELEKIGVTHETYKVIRDYVSIVDYKDRAEFLLEYIDFTFEKCKDEKNESEFMSLVPDNPTFFQDKLAEFSCMTKQNQIKYQAELIEQTGEIKMNLIKLADEIRTKIGHGNDKFGEAFGESFGVKTNFPHIEGWSAEKLIDALTLHVM